jgi:sulfide:quinone oxidoreductase
MGQKVLRMSRIVLVGAGFGGMVACHSLLRKLPGHHEILLITENKPFYMKAAYPMIALGELRLEDVALSVGEVFHRSRAQIILDRVTHVDADGSRVITERGVYPYDYLVLAVGVRYAFERIPGFDRYGQSVKTPEQLLYLQQSIRRWEGGRLLIGALENSCEGPGFEMTFKLHHALKRRHVLSRSEIHFFTDKPEIFQPGGPTAQAYVQKQMKDRGIHTHAGVKLQELRHHVALFENGLQIPADFVLVLPPYEAPQWIANSGLGGAQGYIAVDHGLRSRFFSNIYAVGDAIDWKGPKMAHNAMLGAKVVAHNLCYDIGLTTYRKSFHPEVVCVMDMGGRHAAYIEADTEWGGQRSRVPVTGSTAKFMKESFIRYFLKTKGDVRYIL